MERKRISGLVYIFLLVSITTVRCNKTTLYQYREREILLTGMSGELCSPGYPEYFAGSTQLTWQITTAEKRTVHLKFDFFDVGSENSCYSGLDRSSVEVRDGEINGASLGTFCGSSRPARVSSSGQNLWVRYKPSKFRSTKFKATFTTEKESSSFVLLIAGLGTSFGTLLCIMLTILLLRRRRRRTNKTSARPLINVQPRMSAHDPFENTADNRSCGRHGAMRSVSFELPEMQTTVGNSDLFQVIEFERSVHETREDNTLFATNDSSKELTPVG